MRQLPLSAGGTIDSPGLFTAQVAIKSREDVIARQQAEMIEPSTPVIKLGEGVLALLLIAKVACAVAGAAAAFDQIG